MAQRGGNSRIRVRVGGPGGSAGGGVPIVPITTPLTTMFFGDSETGYFGGYGPTTGLQDKSGTGGTFGWSISKANPAVITFPNSGSVPTFLQTTGTKVFCFGFITQPEFCDVESTITVLSSTQIQFDNIDTSAATTTYGGYGRIYALDTFNGIQNAIDGPVAYYNALTGNRIPTDVKYFRGVPGDPTTQFLNRLAGDMPAKLSGTINCVHLWGGENDNNSYSGSGVGDTNYYTNIFSRLMTCINYIWSTYGNGTLIIIATVCPNSTDTATLITNKANLNNLIRGVKTAVSPGQAGNIVVADYDQATNDGTGNWIQTPYPYNRDIQHWSESGAMAMGQKLRNTLLPLYGRGTGFVLQPSNLIVNPTFAGGTTIAPSWSGTGFGYTGSKNGSDQQVLTVSYASGSNNNAFGLTQTVSMSGQTVGHDFVMEMEFILMSFSGGGNLTELAALLNGVTTPATTGITFGALSGIPTLPFLSPQIIAESTITPMFIRSPVVRYLSGQTGMKATVQGRIDSTNGATTAVLIPVHVQVYDISTVVTRIHSTQFTTVYS